MINLPQRSTLGIYRDCLKIVRHISQEPKTIQNLQKHFRMEFEKQRHVTDKAEHEKFREGMMKFCSNYLYYSIKKDYEDNKKFYDTNGLYDRNTPVT
ncbi:unnamed protein product [Moneuplotes crassus]|uniref:Complex 1 LYR protein domain-containing protein n=1 Tax=Euplotes crassus TaxID=5936 RepID=A0AAD2DBD3_EUPCR|nr:unnamed protein product [Moneuplotes crassus]